MAAGYVGATGTREAREAIARHHSFDSASGGEVGPDDVIIASGASGALEIALTALLDGDSVLLGESAPGEACRAWEQEALAEVSSHWDSDRPVLTLLLPFNIDSGGL